MKRFCLVQLFFIFLFLFFSPPNVMAGPGGPGIEEMTLPVSDDLTVDPNRVVTYGAGDFNLHVRNVLPAYTLLRFNTRGLPQSDRITYAEMTLYLIPNYDANEDEWLTIRGMPPTFSWTETSYRAPSGSFMTSLASTESTVTDPEIGRPITWDVTDFAKAWADGESNRGILLFPSAASPRPPNREDSADFRFESKEHAEVWGGHRPTLTVWYRSSNWFNFEIFQIIASFFTPSTPTPAPTLAILRPLSPTPTQSPIGSKTEFIDAFISPTPTLTLYQKKSIIPTITPTIPPNQLQKSEFIPTYTPTPIKYIQPSSTPTPTPILATKPTLSPTPTKILLKSTPTPTPAKQIKGAFIENTQSVPSKLLSIISWLLILKIIGF